MAEFTFGPIGLRHRRQVRAMAKTFGVSLTEFGGIAASTFHATGPVDRLRGFHAFLDRYGDRDERMAVATEEAALQAQWRWWRPGTWSLTTQTMWLYLAMTICIPGAFICTMLLGII